MSAPYRVRLRTIAARQLWDGRKARGGRGFIPGIRHFQAGVRALRGARRAGDIDATARLTEIEAAFEVVERSLARWRRGLVGFVLDSLAPRSVEPGNGSWLGASRSIRVRAPETRRLVMLMVVYDVACAENRGGDGDGAGSRCIQSAARGGRRACPAHPLGGLCGLLRCAIPAARARWACGAVWAVRRLAAQRDDEVRCIVSSVGDEACQG